MYKYGEDISSTTHFQVGKFTSAALTFSFKFVRMSGIGFWCNRTLRFSIEKGVRPNLARCLSSRCSRQISVPHKKRM